MMNKFNGVTYDMIWPIGCVIIPGSICLNSFTMHMTELEIKEAISFEVEKLNENKFGAKWEYKEGLGIVRIE